MAIDEFCKQAKLSAETRNENGVPIGWLMCNWSELNKYELAHIAIEAMYAAEEAIKRENCRVKSLYGDSIARYYDDVVDALIGIVYFPEEES